MGKIGYARVSTTDQDLSLQLAALSAAGCGVIRSEKITGSTVAGRAELRTVLDFIGKGDTLVVTRIDRLADPSATSKTSFAELKAKGASLVATEQPIDTGTAAGKAFLDMLGVFAEFETNLRRERQMEGIAKSKAAGIYKGGKTRIAADEVRRLAGEGMVPQPLPGSWDWPSQRLRLLSPGKVLSRDDRRPLNVPL